MRAVFLALFSSLALSACALTPAHPGALRPGDLVLLDSDSGARTADGAERLGQLFVSRVRADGSYAAPELLAEDPRWIEPLELLILPDGDVLVLETSWPAIPQPRPTSDEASDIEAAPVPRPPAGSLFRVRPGAAQPVQHLATPSVWRRPVAMARHVDGRLFVSDRSADPLGLGVPTGSVWVFADGAYDAEPSLAAAGPELVTPGALAFDDDGALLVMDADANPLELQLPGGRQNTPGVLYRVVDGGLVAMVLPLETISPIGMLRTDAGELLVVDANFGWGPRIRGDGALFAVTGDSFQLLLDSVSLGRPGALRDPVDGDTLPDGRVVLVDGNLDPLGLGPDDTGKGVHGTGPGALVAIDLEARTLEILLADARFVSPMCVRRVR